VVSMKATVVLTVLFGVAGVTPTSAHGSGARHLGHGHSGQGGGYRSGLHIGIGHARHDGHRYGHGRSHLRHRRHASNISFSFHAPIYPRRHRETVVVEEQHVRSTRPRALPDMPTLTYIARGGQGAGTLTRDRRECERWAWRETRPEPRGRFVRALHTERVAAVGRHRTSLLWPAAGGAALGAIGGAIAGDVGAGATIGALVGATSWLLNDGSAPHREIVEREVHVSEYIPAGGPNPDMLREALASCMQARNYTVQ
jgi:hypothetical protein